MTTEFNNILKDIFYKLYSQMHEYLEYIMDSPSTINRILRYYSIGLPADPELHERYIMFNGKVVMTYKF